MLQWMCSKAAKPLRTGLRRGETSCRQLWREHQQFNSLHAIPNPTSPPEPSPRNSRPKLIFWHTKGVFPTSSPRVPFPWRVSDIISRRNELGVISRQTCACLTSLDNGERLTNGFNGIHSSVCLLLEHARLPGSGAGTSRQHRLAGSRGLCLMLQLFTRTEIERRKDRITWIKNESAKRKFGRSFVEITSE